MREIKNTVWLGVWLIIVPFLGIPTAWKEWLVALTGVCVLAVQFARFRRVERGAPQKETSSVIAREKGGSSASPSSDTV